MKILVWIPYILSVCLFLHFSPINGKQISSFQDNGTDAVPAEAKVASYGNSALIINARFKNTSEASAAANNASKEACEQIPEEKPPDLVVTIKKGTVKERTDAEADIKLTTPSPITEDNEETTEDDDVGDEGGMLIVCNAEYPVHLEFRLNDGYFKYFFRPDVKYCKCGPENCTLCFRIGIWLPSKVWDFVKQTNLTFTCRSISGTASMQKKAVLTRRSNATHNVEILTISTEKLEPAKMPSSSNGRTVSLRFGKCQLDSHDDLGFLIEATEKFTSCKDQHNKDDENLCLENVWERSGHSSNSEAVERPKLSPLLDTEVLQKMTCKFGKVDRAEEHDGTTCGEEQHSESDSNCCPECVMVMLIFSFLFTVPMCWMAFMKSKKRQEDSTLPTATTTTIRVPAEMDSSMHVKWKLKRVVLVH